MNRAPEVNNLRKLRILVAPLDWGLGHATRCIPVIYELLKQKCEVWLAGERAQEALLRQEFPDLPFLNLEGYRVRYSRSAAGMVWSMFSQSRKILRGIRSENEWLKKRVAEHGFDAVISDNRYGLYHDDIPCIFITHQLTIKSPLGTWSERLLQKRNYKYIGRFTECWIPDREGEVNAAGDLSHPVKKPAAPLKYIGLLSRFANSAGSAQSLPVSSSLLIILSGPEPQRSILEEKIIREIAHYPGTANIVRGLPLSARLVPSTNSIKFYNHLPAKELKEAMEQAEYIISRSGYSSVMDMITLRKKSIIVPTPGQTEQEYLGRYLSQKKWALCISQRDFTFTSALERAKDFPYHLPQLSADNCLPVAVSQLIAAIG